MGSINQTKYSGNSYWNDLLFQNVEDGPGSSPQTAIELTIDATYQNYALSGGQLIWLKWTPNYDDELDFFIFANGLYIIPNLLPNYTVYESDFTTQIDISASSVQNFPSGDGPDPEQRETWYVYLNLLFSQGETYYMSFTLPFDGLYGLFIEGD